MIGVKHRILDEDEIRRGIAAYKYEQNMLLRLIRLKKGLSSDDFDRLFSGVRFTRRLRMRPVSGDSFLLGGMNGEHSWQWWLELLQHMVRLDLVDVRMVRGKLTYRFFITP